MLELMKIECEKYLGKWHYIFLILLMLIGIIGSILLLKEGAFYIGNELFIRVLGGMGESTAISVLIGGYVAVSLFGVEIRNSYVLPQGRKKILLSKLYIVISFIVAINMAANVYKLAIFNEYSQGQFMVILVLIISNLILAIALTLVVITLALLYKSKIVNQGSSIIAAIIVYVVIRYGVLLITTAEEVINPLVKYLSIIAIITIFSAMIYSIAFKKEIVRDL